MIDQMEPTTYFDILGIHGYSFGRFMYGKVGGWRLDDRGWMMEVGYKTSEGERERQEKDGRETGRVNNNAFNPGRVGK